MGNYGMKVLRVGYDVDETNLSNYVIHSKYKSLKSLALATTTDSTVSGNDYAQVDIAHGLGYIPLFFVMAELESGQWRNIQCANFYIPTFDSSISYFVEAFANATNLSFAVGAVNFHGSSNTFSVNHTFNFSYYLVIDEIT